MTTNLEGFNIASGKSDKVHCKQGVVTNISAVLTPATGIKVVIKKSSPSTIRDQVVKIKSAIKIRLWPCRSATIKANL